MKVLKKIHKLRDIRFLKNYFMHRCKKRSRKNFKNVKKRGKNKKRLKTLNKKRWP